MKRMFFTLFIVLNMSLVYAEGLPYEIPYGDYYVWDSPVNIRDSPGLNGNVIGQLGLDDKFTVLNAYYDYDNKYNYTEDIDGGYQWWYRIRTENNLQGYIYGYYIATKRVAHDIDQNGIMDYFYIIYGVWGTIYGDFVSLHYPIIYINNKRVSVGIFFEIEERTTTQHPTRITQSDTFWTDAEFGNFQYYNDGKISMDIDFTISNLAGDRHHEVVTFDLTEYK
jgi:hypothetical protein